VRNHNVLPYTKDARELSRALRKNMTPAEKVFWQATKDSKLGVIMRRQMPILDYVVDFYIKDIGVAIEIDGNVHDNNVLEDGIRQARVEKLGVKFLRFTNTQILNELPKVINELKLLINEIKN
jgi:very-short-patch-repair endonuclease